MQLLKFIALMTMFLFVSWCLPAFLGYEKSEDNSLKISYFLFFVVPCLCDTVPVYIYFLEIMDFTLFSSCLP